MDPSQKAVTGPSAPAAKLVAGGQHPPASDAGNAADNAADMATCAAFTRIPTSAVKPMTVTARKRLDLEELQALGESIKQVGMLQPVLVRRHGTKAYDLVTGYRRWLAAALAEIEEIPALVIDAVGDPEALEIALVENLQRRNLTVIEEAEAHQNLIEQFGRTHEQIADLIGRSRSYVSNLLRLLALPDSVKDMLEREQISVGHARALLCCEQPAELAREVFARQLSVRETERRASAVRKPDNDGDEQPVASPKSIEGVVENVSGNDRSLVRPLRPMSSSWRQEVEQIETELGQTLGRAVKIDVESVPPQLTIFGRSRTDIVLLAEELATRLK